MTSEAQDICRAVVCWLEYKSLTGMSGLFSEASLAVPIAEFLSRKHGNEIKSEVPHPLFDIGSKGRPRQIDFVREARGEKRWHAAFECKFQNDSLSDVISDVCRLLCLSQVNGIPCGDRYFVFARKLGEDNLLFSHGSYVEGSKMSRFEKILMHSKGDLDTKNSFKIDELNKKQKNAFEAFAKKYKVPLPSQIVTKLCGLSQGEDYACAIWRISSEKGSKLLDLGENAQ